MSNQWHLNICMSKSGVGHKPTCSLHFWKGGGGARAPCPLLRQWSGNLRWVFPDIGCKRSFLRPFSVDCVCVCVCVCLIICLFNLLVFIHMAVKFLVWRVCDSGFFIFVIYWGIERVQEGLGSPRFCFCFGFFFFAFYFY